MKKLKWLKDHGLISAIGSIVMMTISGYLLLSSFSLLEKIKKERMEVILLKLEAIENLDEIKARLKEGRDICI